MLPGIEARHTWQSTLTLNDPTVYPWYRLKRVNLHDLSEIEDRREPAQGRSGEIVYPSFRRGATVTYEGDVVGRSLAEMREGVRLLRKAFYSLDEGTMNINYAPGYAVQTSYFFTARCVTFSSPDEQAWGGTAQPTGFKRTFVIGLRLSDGRVYRSADVTGNTSPITDTTSGILLPANLPFTLGTGVIGASVDLDNPGGIDSDPTITLRGPVTDPWIKNNTIGKELRFKSHQLLTGEYIVIDFKARTIIQGGTTDARSKLDVVNSTWWDSGVPGVIPGSNVFLYGGAVIGDPAYATISFFPAD